ncbi:MAG: DUF370 domain-containing protein [Oscillospiraceae bacterium]|nr:DUF370 domain-containing protein [Oscillospiraceae bacterium]
MYLHLGQSVVVHEDDIIGVFDLDVTSQSHITRDYLARAEKAGKVVNVSEEIPKSYVLCDDGKRERLYISQLSTATLLKRYESQQIKGFGLSE